MKADRAAGTAGDRDAKLIEAGLALSSELALDSVLQRIVDLAAEITGARYGALAVLGRNGRIADFVTTGISAEERAALGDPPAGRGILGVILEEQRPLRIRDVTNDPRAVGLPEGHPPMRSFLGAPVMARGRLFGNLYLTEKREAAEFTDEDEAAILVLATQAGVAIENARLHEESRLREQWLDAVREIATHILSGKIEGDETLELVAERARELVRADVATIAVPEPGGQTLTLRVAVGAHADRLRGWRFPIADSVSGEVIRFGRAAILDDATDDSRAHQPLVHLGDIGPSMFVPLTTGGRAFGTLAVANRSGGPTFGEEDLRLVETFATQASIVLEHERAQAEVRRLMLLEDRERIAKELHDGVIQALFAVGMGLQGAAALSRNDEQAKRIEGAVAEIDRAIRDLRNYIFGLRPGILADRHLDQAIRELAKEFEEKSGVVTVVDVEEDVAGELASLAQDIVQMSREALSNVGRHANAATCRVTLRREDGLALLEVDDDGNGFDPERATSGQGLANLRDRAAAIGGAAEIESSPETGTIVRISLPL